MSRLKKSDAPALNIQSYIRIRPLGEKEKKAQNLEFGRKDITIKNNSSHKHFTFDRVFEEDSKQVNVYNSVVHPMIKEVLQGYNCTVFAYGQTGTGKTYTMTGQPAGPDESNVEAGIIPRAMEEIFKELLMVSSDYQVAVQYMELYNEKLRSLLSDNSDEYSNVQLIDDADGGLIIKGIPPTPVKNKDDAFNLLLQGQERKQMASTLMNENSSRSHTIFVIIVRIKESTIGDKEEIVRVGKLYLVDLAGSENVSKSGANEVTNKGSKGQRLTEASNINKSLLTLGRVMTALTENSFHVPYRESKLTRILRDSLGGRTKTCVIGTISPTQSNLDETENTLLYAYKARSIKNKPEKNKTISKKDFMQVTSEEILKLKRDLEAVRQGDGFYISQETHQEMVSNMQCLETQVKDWNDRYNKLNTTYEEKMALFDSLSDDFADKCAEYTELEQVYNCEKEKFKQQMLEVQKEIQLREYFLKEYEKTEHLLSEQAKTCKSVMDIVIEHSKLLHDKIDRKSANEHNNLAILDDFKNQLDSKIRVFESDMMKFYSTERDFSDNFTHFVANSTDRLQELFNDLVKSFYEFQRDFSGKQDEAAKACDQMAEDLSGGLETAVTETVKPALEQMTHQFNTIRTIIESEAVKRKEFSEKSKVLAKEASELRRKWSSSNQHGPWSFLTNQFSDLQRKIQQNFEDLEESVDRRDVIAKATSELMKLVEEDRVRTHRDKDRAKSELLPTSESFGRHLQQTSTNFDVEVTNVENLRQTTMEKEADEGRLLLEVEPLLESCSVEKDTALQSISHVVEEKVKVLENLNQLVVNKMEDMKEISKTFSASFNSKLSVNTKEQENLHRSENEMIHQNMHTIMENEKYTSQSIKDIKSIVTKVSYTKDRPLGSTPQRAALKELNYPGQFRSTAPRDVLHQQYKLSLQQRIQADSEVVVSPAIKLEDGGQKSPSATPLRPIQQKYERSLTQSAKGKVKHKLRRSLSAPHLTSPTEDDKENRRLTMVVNKTRGKSKKLKI